MSEAVNHFHQKGIRRCIFGDLYLEDIRAYRDRLMQSVNMEAIYSVWGLDAKELAHRFIHDGFKAILACVDPNQIDASFAGRDYDLPLLADLPDTADPCGENGEFHTFVHDGPIFKKPIPVTKGEIVERGGFIYNDIR